jgi:protein TonB
LFQPDYLANPTWLQRVRAGFGRSATGFVAALALEALLLLLLLSLGRSEKPPQAKGEVLTTFDAKSQPDQAEKPTPARKDNRPRYDIQPPPQPAQQQPAPPVPAPPQPAPPALLQLNHSEMASADLSRFAKAAPSAEKAPAYGPPDTGTPGDTPRVGTAPNGEPMYAAAWYRKPYPGELRGYLSTAQHPGWGLIACKTAPNFRVEDCVVIDEYPDHSNYGNAVAAAAWQFKVRPPRIGGMPMIGTWVQIKIYDEVSSTTTYGAQ